MKNLLISACLLGEKCKYSGGSNQLEDNVLQSLRGQYRLIPVCPETAGGLPTPRTPSERRGTQVVSKTGQDVTEQYLAGARYAKRLAEENHCSCALLKQRSPSCGSGEIYDGTFTGTLIPGDGTAAELLKAAGLTVYGENNWKELLNDGTEQHS